MSDDPTPLRRRLRIINDEPAYTPDAPEPSSPEYKLKAKEKVEVINETSDNNAISVDEFNRLASLYNRPGKKRARVSLHPKLPAPENEIMLMLRANALRDKETSRPLADLQDHPTFRRHRRDYLITLLAGWMLLVSIMSIYPHRVTLYLCLSGVVIHALTVTWIYWFVMDRRK